MYGMRSSLLIRGSGTTFEFVRPELFRQYLRFIFVEAGLSLSISISFEVSNENDTRLSSFHSFQLRPLRPMMKKKTIALSFTYVIDRRKSFGRIFLILRHDKFPISYIVQFHVQQFLYSLNSREWFRCKSK